MNTEYWLFNLILVIHVCDTVICISIEDPDGTHDFTNCGDSTLSTISPQVIGGDVSQIGNFPWQAGLYFRKEKDREEPWEQKCGGSLITDRFVLTAAHCVYNTDEKDLGVALGKIHRSWDHPEFGEQKRNVSKIICPYDFQVETFYFDIALLLLDKKIKLGKHVMPVCSGLLGGSKYIIDKPLFVAGWGQTKDVQSGSSSETLLYTDVTFLPTKTCKQYLPAGFVMFDKFCTIKNNNTELSVIQRGDSGGGLTVVHNKRHYIFGIVSVKLTTSYNTQMTLFTNITWPLHISWIEKEVGKYHVGFKWSEKEKIVPRGCELPNSSPTRKFCTLDNGCDENCNFDNSECLVPPGSSVDKVKVVCAPGFSPPDSSSSDVSFCLRNVWYPKMLECDKQCPPLKSEMLLMTCSIGVDIVDCSKPAPPGTKVSFECAPNFLEYSDQRKKGAYSKVHTCTPSGEWSDDLPTCKAACGVFNKNVKSVSTLIIGGQEAHLGVFPWHASIYHRDDEEGKTVWNYKCGGSLITNRFVLTAGHCVSKITDLTDLRVAVGKYYQSWDVIENSEQKRNVTAVSLPSEHNTNTFTFNVGLVLLSKKVRFGEYVMPVCRDMDPDRDDFQNSRLYIAGWGRTTPGKWEEPSDVLMYNTVTTLNENQCIREVPAHMSIFDKICAVKGDNTESIVQRGDSGGGLTVEYRDGLHYIIGVCSSRYKRISLFTNMKWRAHLYWMETEMTRLEKEYV